MKIVQVAPFEEPVPPRKYGGTELVVANVCNEMVKKGHDVFLLASGDSQTTAQLVPIAPVALRSDPKAKDDQRWRDNLKFLYIADVLAKIKEINPDVVHNHCGWRLLHFQDFISCPMFSTMHGPMTAELERFVYERHEQSAYVSISDNQRKAYPELNWVKTVYNGIDMSRFSVGGPIVDRSYFAFLGRTSPEKGLKEIIHQIKKTSHVLKIAAKVDLADQEYFEKEIKPHVDGKQIQFIGEIGPEEKNDFLKHAKALLLWLNWEEPFGLVVAEAMASGTPVIVNPRGSMPELIVPGKTGFLVKSLDEMAERCGDVDSMSPETCHTHVEANFSARKMTADYLELVSALTR